MWTRWASALAAAGRGLVSSLWRITRQVFHQVTGSLFVLLTVLGATSVWREWRRDSAEWLILLAALFTAAMAGFATASFRSARRVR